MTKPSALPTGYNLSFQFKYLDIGAGISNEGHIGALTVSAA